MLHALIGTADARCPPVAAEPEISVVMAVGNHEDTVGHEIRSVAGHLRRLGRPFEILAVNNGSSDNSLSIVNLLAGSCPSCGCSSRDVSAGRSCVARRRRAATSSCCSMPAGAFRWRRSAGPFRASARAARPWSSRPLPRRAAARGPSGDRARERAGPAVRSGVRAARARAGDRRRRLAPAPSDAASAPPGAPFPGRVSVGRVRRAHRGPSWAAGPRPPC